MPRGCSTARRSHTNSYRMRWIGPRSHACGRTARGADRACFQDAGAQGRPDGLFRLCCARRPRGRSEGRGPRLGQQEGRPDPDEGAAARDGLYPGRLLARGDEKGLSDVVPCDGGRLSLHLRECRCARPATQGRTLGADCLRAWLAGRHQPQGVMRQVGSRA